MQDLKSQDGKQKVAKLMAAGYSIPESDALGMLGDAHSTNYAENRDFFLNQNNPTNFERTWSTAYFLYKKINAVTEQTPFDQVMDFSVIQKLGAEPKYASQKNEYDIQFAPASAGTVQGEKDEILTKTVVIHFFPNSWDINKKITRTTDGKDVEELYDPNVGFVVEEIGKLAGQYGAARIVIEGHTDGSMKASVPEEPGPGAVAQPCELGEGSDPAEVPVAAAQPVLDGGHGLGQAGGSGGSRQQREEPARGGQGLPGGGGAGHQVDADRLAAVAARHPRRPAADDAASRRRGRDGRHRARSGGSRRRASDRRSG